MLRWKLLLSSFGTKDLFNLNCGLGNIGAVATNLITLCVNTVREMSTTKNMSTRRKNSAVFNKHWCVSNGAFEMELLNATRSLHETVINGSFEDVRHCLLEGGQELIDKADAKHGLVALHFASKGNKADVVGLLLDCGADVETKSVDGRSALHVAARYEETPFLTATSLSCMTSCQFSNLKPDNCALLVTLIRVY